MSKLNYLNTIKNILYTLICTTILSTLKLISSGSSNIVLNIINIIFIAVISTLIIFKINTKKLHLMQKILCLFFACMVIIGESFKMAGSFYLIKNHLTFSIIAILFLYYMFTKLFMLLDTMLEKKENKSSKQDIIFTCIEKYPFRVALLCIVVFWSIYIIAWYPGILSVDSTNELNAFFNISSEITQKVSLVNPDVHWTTQHSILHTLFLGIAVKFGKFINNVNLGFFIIYTLPQLICMVTLMAYSIKFMKNQGVSTKIIAIFLALYSFASMYPFYAMTAHQTIYYNIFLITYIILLYDYIKNYENTKYPSYKVLLLTFVSILTILFRNEGRYIILLSLPFALLAKSINKHKILISIALIISFLFTYENMFIKKMEITHQNSAAYLSIPFQQIARYTYFYEDELSENDKEIIDNILVYDTLKERYNPTYVDNVSSKFNYEATNDDIKDFLNVWFKHFLKHPICYLEAFMHQTHTFYYPAALEWYVYEDDLNTEELQKIANLSYTDSIEEQRLIQGDMASVEYYYFPVIRFLLYNGTHFWILLIASYYIFKSNKKYIIPLLPLYLVFLVCLVGPTNWYRYSLPITFSVPFIIAILAFAKKNK